MTKNMFDKNYYTSNNYKDYLNRYDKYRILSDDLINIFKFLNIYNKNLKILDYGCAVGFLLDALKEKKFSNLSGYDISEFCINIFKQNHKLIDIEKKEDFDFIFFLDVLEHMENNEIEKVLNNLKSKFILVRIPCAKNYGESFFLDISKNDPTHINCKTKNEWIDFFKKFNYDYKNKLDYKTIYDSDGVFCGIFEKGE